MGKMSTRQMEWKKCWIWLWALLEISWKDKSWKSFSEVQWRNTGCRSLFWKICVTCKSCLSAFCHVLFLFHPIASYWKFSSYTSWNLSPLYVHFLPLPLCQFLPLCIRTCAVTPESHIKKNFFDTQTCDIKPVTQRRPSGKCY